MTSPARSLILAGLVYYAFMILLYLAREVEGSGLGRFVRIAGVGYFLGMVIFWLEREVLSDVQVVEDARGAPESGNNQQHASSR